MSPSAFAAVKELVRRVTTWRPLIISLSVFVGVLGTLPDCSAQTFVDVNQVTVTKSGLVLDRATNTFNTVVTITNSSSTVLNGPLELVVSNLKPTTVTLSNQTGQSPSGNPFVSLAMPADGLIVGKSIANILLAFSNPTRVAFTFSISVETIEVVPEPLPESVSGPLIESIPPTAVVVGKLMKYQVVASSSNPTSLLYSLSVSSAGMTISATTGLMQWTPAATEVGDQSITIVAQDSRGQTSQSFTLSVFGTNPVTTTLISAAKGGVITVDDPSSPINGLSINIPAGALASDTTITVSELISPPTLGGSPRFLLKGFSVDPDGTSLAVPATVRIPYSLNEFAATQGIALENFLGVYLVHTSTGNLEFLGNFSVDKVNHVVAGTVPHFSVYSMTNIARLCPPPTAGSDCANTYAPATPSLLLPAVLVHGFLPGITGRPLGDESTWGQLRTLLGGLDSGNIGRIDAWRFDWDSSYTPFETAAGCLNEALMVVENLTAAVDGGQANPPANLVNLVAHSFGGIVVRSYLEGQANLFGPVAYRNDVNRVMTIGTPHTGIGGNFSTLLASGCAKIAQFVGQPVTCFEADTGPISPSAATVGSGEFLRKLNHIQLPTLGSSLTPQYDIIIGQRSLCPALGACLLLPDDGLITTEGNKLCGGSDIDVCTGPGVSVETEINPGPIPPEHGLCHSGALFKLGACDPDFNIAMAEVQNISHPLWDKICQFLGCKPAINVTLSDQSAGTVTSDPKGINCGPSCNPPGIDCGSSCTALFDGGTTVTLTATPSAGHTFVGWSGNCSGTAATCVLTTADDNEHLQSGYQVSAVFSEPAGLTLDSASCTEASNVVPSFDGTPFPYRTFTCVFSGSVFGPANTELAVGGPTAFYYCSTTGCQPADFYLYDIPPAVFVASPPSLGFTCGSWSPIPPQYKGLFPPGTLCIRGGTSDQGPRTTWSVTSTFDTLPPPTVLPFDMALNAFTTDFRGTPNSVTRYISTHVVPF